MHKKIFLVIISVILSFFSISYSQNMPDTYFESSYGKLQYGFYVPENYDSTKSYPIIMYLHGWGNNYTVYLDWYQSYVQDVNPCFVYTPKTPTTWGDWSGWWDNLTEPMSAAIHVLDSLISVYSIDTDRVYVYGISMGGEGTFDLLDKFPHKFAAAMSVCGGGRDWWAENISQTPFWMFHGSADNINPPQLTEQVYDELVRIGAKKMRYKNYPGYGHDIWNLAAAEPSWHDWMFAHSRNDTACGEPTGKLELTGSIVNNNIVKLSWNDIRNPKERENKIWYYKIYNKEDVIGTVEYDKTSYVFQAANSIDTFKVSAVNYHFKESGRSNIVCYDNGSIVTRLNDASQTQLHKFNLFDNFPNPFNPATTIEYEITKPGIVKINIYDVTGRIVNSLVDEYKNAGRYSTIWNGKDNSGNYVASGNYFYQILADNFIQTKKMVLLK